MCDTLEVERVVAPEAPYTVYFDLPSETLKEILPANGLTSLAEDAVAVTPEWLKRPLIDNFERLEPSFQDIYAAKIISPPAPNYRDEICFQVAYLAPETLQLMDPSIIEINVTQLYQRDPNLAYVNILDYADYSTTEYYYPIGFGATPGWREIPREIYYWYVVMPKVVMERPKIDSSAMNAFWRDYLWNTATTDQGPAGLTLGDVLPLATTLWDGEVHGDTSCPLVKPPEQGGGTWPTDGTGYDPSWCALRMLGKWAHNVIPSTSKPSPRPNQPNKIASGPGGTCSELRLLMTAACRTGLIPARGAWMWTNDHQWLEIWWEGGWHCYQVTYGRDRTDIAWPDMAHDTKYPHSHRTEDIVLVWAERPDGYPISRICYYSECITLDVNVVDAVGRPVDGVLATLSSDTSKNPAVDGVTTDRDGNFRFKLADARPFDLKITSPVGTYPKTRVVTKAQAVPGAEIFVTCQLSGQMPELPVADKTAPGIDKWKITVETYDGEEFIYGTSAFHAEGRNDPIFNEDDDPTYRVRRGDAPRFDFFITDNNNLQKYEAGQNFEAYSVLRDTVDFNSAFNLPTEENYYLTFSNDDMLITADYLCIRVKLYKYQCAGDFQPDGQVDLYDFSILGLAWRSSLGQVNWNQVCDISEPSDNIIDERDLRVFADNWLDGVSQ